MAGGGIHWNWKVPCAGSWTESALEACGLGRCVEAERQIQFFAEGRVEAQVWREEEAGLWGEQQTRPCLEEAGCSAKRSYLEILAVRSCVSLLGLCLSRLLSQETRAWEDEKEHKFISRSFGSWKSLRSSYGQFGFSLDLSTWLLMASSSLCPHMVLPLSACTPMSLSLCLSLLF